MGIREMMGKTYNTRNRSSSDKMSAALEFASIRRGTRPAGGNSSTGTGVRQSNAPTRPGHESQAQSAGDIHEEELHGRGQSETVGVDIIPDDRPVESDEEIGVVPFDYEEEFRKANRQL